MAKPDIASAPEPLLAVWNRQRDARPPGHVGRHDAHVLSVFLRGSGSYRLGPTELPPDRPLFVFLPAGEDDANGLVGSYESWYCDFRWPGLGVRAADGDEIELTWAGRTVRAPRFKRIDAAEATRAVEAFRALRDALARAGAGGAMAASGLLLGLLGRFLELPRGSEAPLHRALVRFDELLRASACEDVPIARLARQAGIGVDRLRALFRRRHGMRPVAYRTELRLARARDLLAGSDARVGDVARRVGFADPLYFSRVFRSRFGLSPRELIRRNRLR